MFVMARPEEKLVFKAFREAAPNFAGRAVTCDEGPDPPDFVCLDSVGKRVGVELGEWLKEAQVQSDDAVDALLELLANKTSKYGNLHKEQNLDELYLVAYYNKALLYNPPSIAPGFGFRDVARIATSSLEKNPGPFQRIFLFNALKPGSEVIQVWPPQEWLEQFEAAERRPLETRMRYAFVRTHRPVLDDARYRAFSTMEDYRRWCEQNLPVWLGYGRV